MQADTDFLLASLSSLVPDVSDQAVLLEALINNGGNVEKAAKSLTQGKKRKRSATDLQSWFKKSPDIQKSPISPKPSRSKSVALDAKSPTKPVVDLMKVLKQPTSSGPQIPRPAPLTLTTPEMIAKNTTCTLHLSVLPPELACHLFYIMVDRAKEWQRNKWWLFERLVTSPHKTAFFARKTDGITDDVDWQETARYWYNGKESPPPPNFPPEMEEACLIIEKVVNEELSKRTRHPLEYTTADGTHQPWRANVAASNLYEGAAEGVGAHADAMSYLGPYPTIASLSLGVKRVFRLREVVPTDEASSRHAQTLNLELPHNSLTIMHASTQERFKHSIPPQRTIDLYNPSHPRSDKDGPSNSRINITFRFYRPDFKANTTPRCKCDIPMILRPDMKGGKDKYWWTCYNVQEAGKGCNTWQVFDMVAEGRRAAPAV